MKLVVAIIKPFKIEEVTEALHAIGVPGATLSEVRGFGRQRGHTEVYRGAEYKVDYIPKLRLEVIVNDKDADAVVARSASRPDRKDRRREVLGHPARNPRSDPHRRDRARSALATKTSQGRPAAISSGRPFASDE